jgi:myxalamid-type polyketide synthase MxaE and MxaD
MAGAVRDAVGQVLRLAPARIDPRRPFGAMGLDSLMALELRNRLESALGRTLSATLAWNYPTVDALVDYLAGEPGAAGPRAPAPVGSTGAMPAHGQFVAALDAVAALSDDEIARALRVGR